MELKTQKKLQQNIKPRKQIKLNYSMHIHGRDGNV